MNSDKFKPNIFQFFGALMAITAFNVNAAGPMVQAGTTQKIADGVYVIPDQRVNLVPNIGIIVGNDAAMVVDTGMGPKNAEIVLAEVRKITDKPIRYLAITHFHPEHGMGAQSFPPETAVVVPQAQKEEFAEKGAEYIELFKGFSPDIAALLADVKLVTPHLAFEKSMEIDLGGRTVQLLYLHPGHTRGDMFVYLPAEKILFGGDLIIDRFYPILPDNDATPVGWVDSLKELKVMAPAIIVPGHGAVGDVVLIDALLAYFTDVKSRVSMFKAEGKSVETITAQLQKSLPAAYSNWDNPEWIKNLVEKYYPLSCGCRADTDG